MSVSQRKDGRWLVKFKADGQWRQRAFRNEAEARAFDAECYAAAQENDDRLTLGELTMSFFRSRPDYNHETKRHIVNHLAGWEDAAGRHHDGPGEFLRDKYADSLTRRDLEAMREAMRANGTGPATINKMQAYIRAILAWGVDQQLIPLNPWRDFKRLKAPRPAISVSLDAFRAVYPFLPEYLQWAVKTAFFLALRPGQVELWGLLWTAFHWQRGIVIVRQGKSGRLKTVVPHPAYMEEARARYEADSKRGIVLVCNRNGQRVLSVRTAWETACRRAGVTMRLYDIRHLAATSMLAAGADLAAVAAQLGHSNVATTGATYAHVTAGAQARAAALMPGIEQEESKWTK